MERIGIIGCGNLGLSMLKGFRKQFPQAKLIASRRDISQLTRFQDEKTQFTTINQEIFSSCEYIIIALKPFTILSFLEEHKAFIDPSRHTIISVATGVQLLELAQSVQLPQLSLYRGMPNTAADVQEGMTTLCALPDPLNRKESVDHLFQAIGETIWIEEQLMESATILGA